MKPSAHTTGDDCNCTRLKCFENVDQANRQRIIDEFNKHDSKDQQDAMIASTITPSLVKQRRPRKAEEEAAFHKYAYNYHIIIPGVSMERVQVCFKAILAFFGVTKARLERIQKSLTTTGLPPKDMRGKHANRPKAFSDLKVESIINHIRGFRGRKSHYALGDSKKLYLPEDLNLSKMHAMYLESHPGETCSRESYRRIFEERFNVSFGNPRKDTCSTCDSLTVKLAVKDLPMEQFRQLSQEKELHLRKGAVFYERKSAAAQQAQGDPTVAAVCFDFWKNLPTPNISTNDVYYRRQLSTYTFNVHNLGSGEVYLFTYDETVGKKGSNEVASMLHHFFTTILSPTVTNVLLFCDSCPGQNKSWTVLRYLHNFASHPRRFKEIKLTFPIRGHSYMECDRDMILTNQKLPVSTPRGWASHFEKARVDPSPFNVVRVDKNMLFCVGKHISNKYVASCPIKTQPIREVIFSSDHPRLLQYRESWNGLYSTAVVRKPAGKRRLIEVPLQPSNQTALKITAAKFKDLQCLKQFIPVEEQLFYDRLPHQGQPQVPEDDLHSDIDDEEEEEEL